MPNQRPTDPLVMSRIASTGAMSRPRDTAASVSLRGPKIEPAPLKNNQRHAPLAAIVGTMAKDA